MSIWINRAVVFILYFAALYVVKKLNLCPAFTFTFAVVWVIGVSFIFEIIEYLIKQGGKWRN